MLSNYAVSKGVSAPQMGYLEALVKGQIPEDARQQNNAFNPQALTNPPVSFGNIILGSAPAMEVFNGQIYCAFKSHTDNSLYVTTSSDGIHWVSPAPQVVGAQVVYSDVSLKYFNGALYAAFVSENNTLGVYYTEDGESWNNQLGVEASNVQLSSPPTLAVYNGQLCCFFSNNSNQFCIMTLQSLKEIWSQPYVSNQLFDVQYVSGVTSNISGTESLNVIYGQGTNNNAFSVVFSQDDSGTWSHGNSSNIPNVQFAAQPLPLVLEDTLYLLYCSPSNNNLAYATSNDGVNWANETSFQGVTMTYGVGAVVHNNTLFCGYGGTSKNEGANELCVVNTAYTWQMTPNVAQWGALNWDNEIIQQSNMTPREAMKYALSRPEITYFFNVEAGAQPFNLSPHGTFNPGDTVFFTGLPWYGSAPQSNGYQKVPNYVNPSQHPPLSNQMLMLKDGSLLQSNINLQGLSQHSFTVSLMVEAQSAGTLITARDFSVELNSNGSLEFIVYNNSANPPSAMSITSSTTPLMNDGHCHTLTCTFQINHDTWSDSIPTIYLDGQPITQGSPQTATPRGQGYFPLLLGNNHQGNAQYQGGLMNVGLWTVALHVDDFMMAGAGMIGNLTSGLAGFWSLNGSFVDRSANQNPLDPNGSELYFMTCTDCVWIARDASATFVQISGPLPSRANNHYTRKIVVEPNSPLLVAAITDGSGYARFPAGVTLTITDPNGVVYNGNNGQPVNSDTAFATPSSDGSSLFSLMVNNPPSGEWTLSINTGNAPDGTFFLFQFQTFPYSNTAWILQSTYENLPPIHHRAFHSQSLLGDIGRGLMAVGTVIVCAAATLATGGTAPFVMAAMVGLGAITIGADAAIVDSVNTLANQTQSQNNGAASVFNVPIDVAANTFAMGVNITNTFKPIPLLNTGNITRFTESISPYGVIPRNNTLQSRMVFVQFSDVQFNPNQTPATLYNTITNTTNSTFFNQSYGILNLNTELHSTVITLNGTRNSYIEPTNNNRFFKTSFFTAVQNELSSMEWSNKDIAYIVAAGTTGNLTSYYSHDKMQLGNRSIVPIVFSLTKTGYYTPPVLIHETGHALGLPDLYLHRNQSQGSLGAWDYMSDNHNAHNFLAWHRHKLCWLPDNRTAYVEKQPMNPINPEAQTQWVLTPANSASGTSLLVLCDDFNSTGMPQERPSRVIAIEIAQPCKSYPHPQGVLIYRVHGDKASGQMPVELIMPSKGSYANAPWGVGQVCSDPSYFNISIVSNDGAKWTVEITPKNP